MGTTTLRVQEQEQENKMRMRRGLHLARDLDAGETVTEADIKIVRPFEGIEPWQFDEVIELTVTESVQAGQPLEWSLLE